MSIFQKPDLNADEKKEAIYRAIRDKNAANEDRNFRIRVIMFFILIICPILQIFQVSLYNWLVVYYDGNIFVRNLKYIVFITTLMIVPGVIWWSFTGRFGNNVVDLSTVNYHADESKTLPQYFLKYLGWSLIIIASFSGEDYYPTYGHMVLKAKPGLLFAGIAIHIINYYYIKRSRNYLSAYFKVKDIKKPD